MAGRDTAVPIPITAMEELSGLADVGPIAVGRACVEAASFLSNLHRRDFGLLHPIHRRRFYPRHGRALGRRAVRRRAYGEKRGGDKRHRDSGRNHKYRLKHF